MCGIIARRAATTMIYPITTRKHKQWIQFFAMPRCWTFLPCQVSQCHKNFYISKCFNRSSHFNVLFSSWFKNWSIKIFYVNQLDNYSIVQFLDWLRITLVSKSVFVCNIKFTNLVLKFSLCRPWYLMKTSRPKYINMESRLSFILSGP